MTDKILSILNPVHLPTVSEWMEIAELVAIDNDSDTATYELFHVYKELQSRFEELTRGKLTQLPFDKPDLDAYKHMGAAKQYATDCDLYVKNKTKYYWQPALLKKEMVEGEQAWFEIEVDYWKPQPIDFTKSVWYWIIDCEQNAKGKVKYTEFFVKELLK